MRVMDNRVRKPTEDESKDSERYESPKKPDAALERGLFAYPLAKNSDIS